MSPGFTILRSGAAEVSAVSGHAFLVRVAIKANRLGQEGREITEVSADEDPLTSFTQITLHHREVAPYPSPCARSVSRGTTEDLDLIRQANVLGLMGTVVTDVQSLQSDPKIRYRLVGADE